MSILNGEADAGKELFELPVMIKADVQGSEQALSTALRYRRWCFGVFRLIGASFFGCCRLAGPQPNGQVHI